MHKPEFVQENETDIILRNFDLQTDPGQMTRTSINSLKKKNLLSRGFRVKIKDIKTLRNTWILPEN